MDFSGVIPGVRGRLGDDEIFALHRLAMERAAKGESILNSTLGTLATEDGQLAVMPSVLETMARLQGPVTAGYAPVAGKPDYLRAVIKDVFADGPLARQAVSAAVPGGTGAIYQAVVNFLEPGQKLLATNFHWGPYPGIARNLGRDFEKFQMFTEDGAFDVEALTAAVDRHIESQGRVLVVLNFPCHNPTGYSLDSDEWRATCDVLRAAGERAPVTVLFDIAYFWFARDDAKTWVDWVPALLESTTVLVAWTASKSYCQYGSRTGAIIGLHRDPAELDQIRNAFGYTCRGTWSNCNHLGQLAATELIMDPELNARWAAERDALVELLDDRIVIFNDLAAKAELRMPRYKNGFFLIAYTPDAERTASAMRDVGVFVLPIPGAVRVALCHTPKKDLPRLVDALKIGVAAAS
jgi:aromatic-amino-acid transaminase